ETIQGILVVHPRLGPLEDDEAITRLRDELNAWVGSTGFEGRVVIDLDQVPSMSSRVLGMLLALALRLERQGGRLRLCRANARVSAMLDAIRLPLLVDLLPTLDDAVISAWE
ncbi:MAG TPA: STAS domain-containing protein, partial [Isosphaeraceae bacterium]|nr:STAS domain-containing protein [Isosphaeraceae bacterium]